MRNSTARKTTSGTGSSGAPPRARCSASVVASGMPNTRLVSTLREITRSMTSIDCVRLELPISAEARTSDARVESDASVCVHVVSG